MPPQRTVVRLGVLFRIELNGFVIENVFLYRISLLLVQQR